MEPPAVKMGEAGHRVRAGQSVRLLDVPVAPRQFGAWDTLHGFDSGRAFSDHLKRAWCLHHGHAGRAFLEKLTHDRRDLPALLETARSLPMFQTAGDEGQEKRAAGRFALIGMAGELATEYGITTWPEGAALAGAGEFFKVWAANRGRGNDERRQVLGQVSGFLDRHGDARFSRVRGDASIRDRAGWWDDETDGAGRVYLFTPEGLREALRGFDFKRALDVLQAAGALPPANQDGERARQRRIGGRKVHVYPIVAEKLEVSHGA